MSQLWRISVQHLGRDLSEASELATVLQEVAPELRVEGIAATPTSSRPSSSSGLPSGTPTALSIRERVRRARPIDIGPSCVPWHRLTGVVSSEALQDVSSQSTGGADGRPQLLEVNTGGSVFFLLFAAGDEEQQPAVPAHKHGITPSRLSAAAGPEAADAQHHQHHQHSQREQPQLPVAVGECSRLMDGDGDVLRFSTSRGSSSSGSGSCGGGGGGDGEAADDHSMQLSSWTGSSGTTTSGSGSGTGEGVAVLKVASSRLAMQAEQFANELSRHLGVAAPLCRLVRQIGEGAGEWAAARDAADQLGEAGDELSGELGRLPCFLLMEYVAGAPLLGACAAALQVRVCGGEPRVVQLVGVGWVGGWGGWCESWEVNLERCRQQDMRPQTLTDSAIPHASPP